MSKRFVSWIAVSSLPQAKKISLEDQLKTNREHVTRWGGVMVAELEVPGESRSIVLFEDACQRIEAYAHLHDLIKQRAFDVLIYLDRSRLGRVASLSMTVVELCHQAGIVPYATESPPSSLDVREANFAASILGAVESVTAQEEVKKLTRRHDMGMTARVMRGDFPGRIPYGWTVRYEMKDEKPVEVIEVDEQAAAAIRHIVDLYLNRSIGVAAMGALMRRQGYPPPRTGAWGKSSIVSVFDSIWRYAGFVELNRSKKSKREYIRVKSRWPAIISEEDAKKVCEERRQRTVARRAVSNPHRFTRCVWCKRCNKKMVVSLRKSRNTRHPEIVYRSYVYRCLDHEGRITHPQNSIAANYIGKAVRQAILYVQDEANRQRIAGEATNKPSEIQDSIDRLAAQLAKHEKSVQRIDDAYADGALDAARYQRQVDRLLSQRANMEAELARYRDQLQALAYDNRRHERLAEIAANGIANLEADDGSAANAWFRRHIKVWVENDKPHRVIVEYL